jgi:hypothetical protein
MVVYLCGDQYLIRHEGPYADVMHELYGTDTLPSGWPATAPLEEVLRELRRRNPDVEVATPDPESASVEESSATKL